MLGGMALTVNPLGLDVGLHRNSSTQCFWYVEQQIYGSRAKDGTKTMGMISVHREEKKRIFCVYWLGCTTALYRVRKRAIVKRAIGKDPLQNSRWKRATAK